MLDRLFGKKKNKGDYFLEIEGKSESQTETQASNLESSATTQKVAAEPTPKAQAVEEVAASTATGQKPDATKATVNKKKSTSKTKTSTTKTKVAAYEPPEWVKAIKNYSNNGQSETQQLQENSTFATKYLMANPPQSRRRPGPSLNRFKEMVNTMKISLK